MGNIINMVISNDLLFYGIIVFLIVGVIVLFMYLHHKKIINLLEEEIEFTKVEDGKISDSLQTLAKVSNLEQTTDEIEEKLSKLDGKSAIAKILNEDEGLNVIEEIKIDADNKKSVIDNVESVDATKESKSLPKENISNTDVNKNEQKSELELMLEKMQHDLEEQKEKDAVAIFEQEQEEKSIISYKELLERKNELTSSEILNDERFENEPTLIEDDNQNLTDSYMNLVDNVNNTISIDNIKEENDTKSKRFVTTDFISPVFGRRKAEFDYPKVPNFKDMMIKREKTNEYDLEATMNLEPLTEQIKKDDAFLSALKEFRKNLE